MIYARKLVAISETRTCQIRWMKMTKDKMVTLSSDDIFFFALHHLPKVKKTDFGKMYSVVLILNLKNRPTGSLDGFEVHRNGQSMSHLSTKRLVKPSLSDRLYFPDHNEHRF